METLALQPATTNRDNIGKPMFFAFLVSLAFVGPVLRGGDWPATIAGVDSAVATTAPRVAAHLPMAAPKHHHGGGTLSEQLEAVVRDENPAAAFVILRAAIAADPSIQPRCHTYTHDIGYAAFAKYGTLVDAMAFADDLCGSGYVHSLVAALLRDVPDALDALPAVCAPDDGYCQHGLGHGLMFHFHNDVPRALDACATLDGVSAMSRCAEGVYMQNFEGQPQADPTPFLNEADPLALCRDEHRFTGGCVMYAGRYFGAHAAPEEDVFARCGDIAPKWRWRCVSGVGASFMIAHLQDESAALAACEAAPDAQARSGCVDGLVSYHLVNYGSLERTRAWCASMAPQSRVACGDAVIVREKGYAAAAPAE